MKKKYFLGILLCYVVTGMLMIGSTIRNNTDYRIDDTVLAEKIEGQSAVRETDIQNTEVVPSGTEDSDAEQPPQNVFQKVDKSYLDDALFIGHSRTLGLMEYGGVSQASYFADSGMSVFNLEKTTEIGRAHV